MSAHEPCPALYNVYSNVYNNVYSNVYSLHLLEVLS